MARRGRPLVVAWHDKDTEAALRAAYRAERDPALRQRLQALWLLRRGTRHLAEVASVIDVEYRTVQRWVAWYRRGGGGMVCAHRLGGPGKAAWLTPEQQEELAQEVATGRFRNATAIRAWSATARERPWPLSTVRACRRSTSSTSHSGSNRRLMASKSLG